MMTALKLCLLLLLALAVLFIGIFHLDADGAQWLQSFFGYYLCLLVFSLVLFGAWQTRRGFLGYAQALGRSQWVLVLALSGLATYLLLLHEPFTMRVFNDEPGHLATAQAMAEGRAVFSPQAGFYEAGAYATARPGPNYRMYAYPFVISVLHNLTGNRVGNAYIVNGFALFVLSISTFLLGRTIGRSHMAGCAALALLLTSPLLAQVGNSGAYDVFNLSVLALYLLSCIYYSRRRGILEGLNLCLALGLLLAYSRSESILFLIIFIGIFLSKCWQLRRIELTWVAALSPILLMGPFAGRVIAKIFSASFEEIYEQSSAGFFSISYLIPNFVNYWRWSFSLESSELNAYLIKLLFFTAFPLSILALSRAYWLQRRREHSFEQNTDSCPATRFYKLGVLDRVLFGFLCILAVQNLMILSMSWPPVDLAAIRFYLPSTFFMVLGVIWALRVLRLCWFPAWERRSYTALAVCAVCYFWASSLPKAARAELTHMHSSSVYASRALDWVQAQDDGKTLYVVRSVPFFTLHEIPCVGLDYFRRNYKQLSELVEMGVYDSIKVIDFSFYTHEIQGWRGVGPYIDLPPELELEPLNIERGYIHAQLTMSKVLGWRNEDDSVTPIGTATQEPTFGSDWELFETVRRLRGAAVKGAGQ